MKKSHLKYNFNLILGSKGLLQSLLTVFGNLGATGISAVSIILISRSLGPEKFGEFSVGFAVVAILSKINDLGFTFAQLQFIPQHKNDEKKNRIFSYVIKIKFIVALLIALIGSLLVPFLAAALGFQNTTILYASFALSFCVVACEQLLAMLQSLHKFFQAVLVTTIQASSKLFFAIVAFFFFQQSTVFAFFTYMIAPIIPVLFSVNFLPKKTRLKFSQNFTAEKTKLWNMAAHSAVGFIALGIIDNIDILFVQKYLDTYETGLLGGVSRIALLFSVMAYSLSTVLNARVARYQNKVHITKYVKKAVILSTLVAFGYMLILPLSKYAILYTIGREYLSSLSVLNILLGASFITIITTPFAAIFFSLKKFEWYFSVSGVVQLVLIILGNIVFVPLLGVAGAAWVRTITKIIILILTVAIAAFAIFTNHFRIKNKEMDYDQIV